jgi:hypothetical protein
MTARKIAKTPISEAAQEVLVRAARKAEFDLLMARSGPLGLEDYIVKESKSKPGNYGIYLRKFNLCCAVFAGNNYRLRELLKNLFDDAAAAKAPDTPRYLVHPADGGPDFYINSKPTTKRKSKPKKRSRK